MSTPCRGVVAWRTLTVIGPWGVITTCGVACAATAAGRCCGTQQKNQQKNQRKMQHFFAKKLRLELRLLMSFSWLCFPGVIWTRFFSPHGFPGFWDSIPKRCKGVHCVDLGESFPTSIYSQNLASYSRERALTSSKTRAIGNLNLNFQRLVLGCIEAKFCK